MRKENLNNREREKTILAEDTDLSTALINHFWGLCEQDLVKHRLAYHGLFVFFSP